ncbi:MAG TPA: hypothetical protein VM681_09205 [Candidatus Thermoplasmatota archaeon]|nr:hypothetical protein [Candidatus Thermoplasmatota archaeon]
MAFETLEEFLPPLSALAALAFVVVVVRLAMLLYANPLGAFAQEILYLRANALRLPLALLAVFLLLESVQALLPFLVTYQLVPSIDDRTLKTITTALGLLQAVLLVAASLLMIRIFSRYTKRGVQQLVRRATDELVRATRRRRPKEALRRS